MAIIRLAALGAQVIDAIVKRDLTNTMDRPGQVRLPASALVTITIVAVIGIAHIWVVSIYFNYFGYPTKSKEKHNEGGGSHITPDHLGTKNFGQTTKIAVAHSGCINEYILEVTDKDLCELEEGTGYPHAEAMQRIESVYCTPVGSTNFFAKYNCTDM